MKMVKVVVGLMGSSAASGSAKMSGTEKLKPLLDILKSHKIRELDTARAYNNGHNEEDLGTIPFAKTDFSIHTKAPGFSPESLAYERVKLKCNESLAALKQDSIDLYYFHGPDPKTPVKESCRAIHDLHQENKIKAFGISNYSPKQVEEIHALCSKNGWIVPTVYQGMYNPLMRTLESSLLAVLRKLSMNFYAYSPLAGGFFSRSKEELQSAPEGSRMDQMKVFKNMFVNEVTLQQYDHLHAVCTSEKIPMKEAALRWIMHHSALTEDDAVILGGSSAEQLEENLKACEAGSLPQSVVDAFETMWKAVQAGGKAPVF
ncbi:Hypothetical protein R9X50_00145400 [Acrodontium crateriforme]|uniref:NADP-dependent oxidoreductase domain-containing protein n=1 Tax=Acrodontium crateriforme TaxID=150365 RepID=A0AAQ3LZ24_9PEZI|nr:Hypothetical protein R9X50_00145400 [Acrodontium crateriforme]